MIKKEEVRNGKKILILYENDIYIEENDRPHFLIGWFSRDDVGKLFKSQDIILQIRNLGDPENNDIINVENKGRYRIILEKIEDE